MSNNSTIFSCFVNVSADSLTEIAWRVESDEPNFDKASNGYAIAAFVILFLLLGLPWNLFVICAIIKKRLYSQPIIMLMLNLAITNLLVCILVMPFNIVSGIASEYVFGESDLVRCRVCQTGIITIILPLTSVHTLCLMSIDRFIYLKRPMMYSEIVTLRRMLAAIMVIWLICITVSLPPLVGFGNIIFAPTVATCAPYLMGRTHVAPNYFYTLLLVAEGILPIVTLFVLYVWILCVIVRAQRKDLKRKARNGSNAREGSMKKHKQSLPYLVGFFATIFTANLVTWLPMVALILSGAILGPTGTRVPTPVHTIAYLSYLSQTLIHPVLEAFHIREVQKTIYQAATLFKTKCKMCCTIRRKEISCTGASTIATAV